MQIFNSVNHKNKKSVITSLLLIALLLTPLLSLIQIPSASAQPTTVLTPKWTRSNLGTNWEGGLVAGDVTGDGVDDVVFAGGGAETVYVLNGINGNTVATYTNSRIAQFCQPQLYDVDGDGVLDILLTLYYEPGLAAVKYDGDSTLQQLWIANTQRVAGEPTPSGSIMAKPVAGDIDNDGDLDIFIASQDTSPNGGFDGTIVKLDHNGNEVARSASWRACSGGLSLADADNDGVFEIYQGDRQMGYSDGGYGKGAKSYWADNLTERWVRMDFLCSSQAPVITDINGDGIQDVSAGMYREMNILDSRNGAWINRVASNDMSVHYAVTIYDIDGDGNPELLCNDGDHDDDQYADVFDLVTGALDAELSTGPGVYNAERDRYIGGDSKWSPIVADIDPTHDGMEIIMGPNGTGLDGGGMYSGAIMIWSSNYESLQNITRAPGSTPGTYSTSRLSSQLGYAVVQDIDNDNRLELVTHASSGSVYAFDTLAPKPEQRIRSEVSFYGEHRTGAAVYDPLPWAPGYWTAPLVAPIYPADNAVAVPITTNQLRFQLREHQSEPLTYSVTTSPNIGSSSGSINSGTYDWNTITVPISGLAYDTTYTYTVTASNGTEVTSRTYTFRTALAPNADNHAPTQAAPTMVSLDGQDTTSSNFVTTSQSTADLDGDSVTNIYRWKLNDQSLTKLLLPFDTRHETTAMDYSGFGNNGVVRGATWVADGKIGGAYRFDGKDDAIVVSDGGMGFFNGRNYTTNKEELGGFGNWNGVTVEAWIYLTENNDGTRFVAKVPSYSLGFRSGQTNMLTASVWPMTFQVANKTDDPNESSLDRERSVNAPSSSPLSLNTWYHIAFTYESGVGLKLYINGELVSQSAAYVGPVKISRGEPLYIGRLVEPFAGMIDEVRLYGYAVPSEQIHNRYMESKDGDTSSSTFLPAGVAHPGDTLSCDVIPTDSYTEGTSSSASTMVVSSKPVASNLQLFPLRDRTYRLDNENLVASYDYSEADGIPESGTQIRWYKNGVLQSSFNDLLQIPSGSTTIGDAWYFTVQPRDAGGDIGFLQTSSTFIIRANSVPIAGSPILDSMNGGVDYDDEDLVATAGTTTDSDGDTTTNIYRWTKDGVSMTNLQMPFDTEVPLVPGVSGATHDYSGYNNNGVVNGATWVQDGIIGGALSFGGDDYMTVQENSNSLGGNGDWSQMTVEFWVKASGSTTSTQTVVFKPDASYGPGAISYGTGYRVQYRYYADSYRVYWIVGNNSAQLSFNQRIYEDPNQWHHVVCTYKSGVGLKIYTDGIQRGSTLPATGNINATLGGLLYLGGVNSGLGDFSGQLDEVRIYPIALSDAQVFQRYIDTSDGNSNNETIVAQETSSGDNWLCQVIPNDSWNDGAPVSSASLQVNAVVGNSRPSIDWYSPANATLKATVGSTISFMQNSSDPNGDNLSYVWTLDSTVQATTQNWNYTANSVGTHAVRVTVSDGALNDYREWVINVENIAPLLNYTLTVSPSTNGTTNPATGVYQYPEGSQVTIQAIPNEGYRFSYWLRNGTNVGNANPYEFNMDANYVLSAVFTEIPQVTNYTLTVAVSGSGIANPAGEHSYDAGTIVQIEATANAGATFSHWIRNGTDIGSTNPYMQTMDANYQVTAVFTDQPVNPPFFEDGFESGTFDAWSSTARSTGETTAVTDDIVNQGSNSAVFTSNGEGGYERAHLSQSGLSLGEVYARAYVYVDQSGIVDNADRFYFLQLVAGSTLVGYAGWRQDTSGNIHWQVVTRDGTDYAASYSSTIPSTDKWYCVELHWKSDASAGLGELYVDGEVVASVTNRNTANYGNTTILRVGLPDIYGCAATTTHIDDVAIGTSYIGPVQTQPPEHVSLTIEAATGGTTNPIADIYQLDKNSVTSVSATPSTGYTLTGWLLDGTLVANTNPYTLTMDADHTIAPVFTLIPTGGVLEDNFESGTLAAWTTSATSGETVGVTTAPVYSGTYAASFTSNATGGYERAYLSGSIATPLNTVNVTGSFLLSQNGIVENNDRIKLIELRAGSAIIASAGVIERSATLRWWLESRDNTNYVESYAATSTDLSNWFTLQLLWQDDASNGGASLTVNESPIMQVNGDNTSNYGGCTEVRIGLTDVYNCGATALSVDDVTVATDDPGF